MYIYTYIYICMHTYIGVYPTYILDCIHLQIHIHDSHGCTEPRPTRQYMSIPYTKAQHALGCCTDTSTCSDALHIIDFFEADTVTYAEKHTHTHGDMHIYIYIYICISSIYSIHVQKDRQTDLQYLWSFLYTCHSMHTAATNTYTSTPTCTCKCVYI